ncbi:BlaI/MecI/CopY family transcriptional regulator [Iamia sp.]|uniref:BlaI/MecI/CopY family transcriptional regulator n=1 Tax=Iamia sp. TaxID=2722710 RepID=UPI002CAD0568|nr:BlaI/MecI/CopY family transcriptional regulator [Iamia sp.]HXH59398.1 BlaI/MecI/CopY family transcriptional regulator [Iamia sp.]
MAERRATGSLEREVLEQLWQAPQGATPRDVRAAMDDELAYTTIMTILRRLWQKGLAERELHGRAYVYRAKASEADLAANGMHAAFAPVRDRREALTRFVDGLSKSDARALRRVLDEPR